MNLIDRARVNLAKFIYKASVASIGNLQLIPDWVQHSFFQPIWQLIIREGYKGNSAVFACVEALGFAFPEPSLQVLTKEPDGSFSVDEKNPLLELFEKPNETQGLAEFLMYMIVYCSLGGNAYAWIKRDRFNAPIALFPFSDGHVEPVPSDDTDENSIIKCYKYFPNGVGNETDMEIIPAVDMVHWIWMPDPDQPWRGIGAITSITKEVDTDNESTRYLFDLLKNDAVPRTVMTYGEGYTLTKDKVTRLRKQWTDIYGPNNRGGVAFLEKGEGIERIGFDLNELAFESIKAVPEARIAAVFRVPAIIAGLNIGLAKSTYSNYKEAREAWTEDTLVKLWTLLSSELTQKLAREGQKITFDLSKVAALGEQRAKVQEAGRLNFQAGIITRAEVRKLNSMPITDADDVFYIPFSVVIIPRETTTSEPVPSSDEGAAPDTDDEEEDQESEQSALDIWWGVKESLQTIIAGLKKHRPIRSIKSVKQRREAQRASGEALQRVRRQVSGPYEAALNKYFRGQAQRVISRLSKFKGVSLDLFEEKQDVPPISQIWFDSDDEELIALSRRFTTQLFVSSWDIWNFTLNQTVAFDLTDPLVIDLLNEAGQRIVQINNDTRQAIADILKEGADLGLSVDQIARGGTFDVDGQEVTVVGLRDSVEQLYKNRDRAIARTELGHSQNNATVTRYEAAGVDKVFVLDNGFENSDPVCIAIDGAVRSLEWAQAAFPLDPDGLDIENPLQHPNCVRAIAPEF